jgi:hypothetical protein
MREESRLVAFDEVTQWGAQTFVLFSSMHTGWWNLSFRKPNGDQSTLGTTGYIGG